MSTIIMNTEQYAKEVYIAHSKTGTASQQLIRRMIKEKKPLPQVNKVMQSGKYHLLEVNV